jgi:hypothetical protein
LYLSWWRWWDWSLYKYCWNLVSQLKQRNETFILLCW